MYSRAKAALLSLLVVSGAAVVTAVVGYVMASPTFGWTGAVRLLQRLHQAWSCPCQQCATAHLVQSYRPDAALHVEDCRTLRHLTAMLTSDCCASKSGLLLVLSLRFDCPGRSLSLLDPTYASKYIPIIASVSEHQPPAWPSYFTDLNFMVSLGVIATVRIRDEGLERRSWGAAALQRRLIAAHWQGTCCAVFHMQ